MNIIPAGTPMGKLSVEDVLIEHDGPRLFMCVNDRGEHYIATFVDEDDESELHLYASVSESRLRDAIAGRLALREMFQRPDSGEVWLVSKRLASGEVAVNPIASEQIPDHWLPAENVRLGDSPESSRS